MAKQLSKFRKVLKRSESGMEVEYHIIDEKGDIYSNSKKFLEELKKIKNLLDVDPEIVQNQIEIRSTPDVKLKKTIPAFLEDLAKVLEVGEKLDLKLYPFATYPGKFTIIPTKKPRYRLQAKVLGKDRCYNCWGRCTGFHFHYALPKGVFDYKKEFLKPLIDSKTKQTLIDSYNLLIAADPALSTLLQSSPFVDGHYLAKDSRMLILRGGAKLRFKPGLFTKFKLYGNLPIYIHTLEDISHKLKYMDRYWKRKLIKVGEKKAAKKKKLLDFVWNPVKINKIGTLEQRGMDTNYPKYLIGAGVLIKYILRLVQQDFYRVIPSDIGLKEPFKVEGETIHIPPISKVRNELQFLSAYEGIKNEKIYYYTKRFFSFAKRATIKTYGKSLKPLARLIDKKKTISDYLISDFKRKGYDIGATIPQSVCRDIALKTAERMEKEVERATKLIT